MRMTQPFSFSVLTPVARALEQDARQAKCSIGEHLTAIVVEYLDKAGLLPEEVREELKLLRELRNDAVEKMGEILDREGFSQDITLRVFQACKDDPTWVRKYEDYIRGNRFQTGNARKTNANQTIGSRIKSELGAEDVLDKSGKPARGRALGEVIQTYQLLRR